jgi:hypothetical protein
VTRCPKEVAAQLTKNRQRLKQYADRQTKESLPLKVGEQVLVKEDLRKWFSGEIGKKHETSRSCIVKISYGKLLRRNTAHLRKSKTVVPKPRNTLVSNETISDSRTISISKRPEATSPRTIISTSSRHRIYSDKNRTQSGARIYTIRTPCQKPKFQPSSIYFAENEFSIFDILRIFQIF